MNKVAIITDSASYIPQEIVDKYNIKVMPMGITIEGKTYPETELDLAWFYQQMPHWREAGKIPLTSSVSIGTFLEAYREISQKAEAILCIGHSSKLGMSVNAARQAKQMAQDELPDTPIEVIDSYTACGAFILIVLQVARAAAAGKDFSEVVEVANNAVKSINYIYLADDLYYMAKTGRIHKARPWAASKITNTVLLTMDASTEGAHTPLARYKTKAQALEGLFGVVKQRSDDKKLHVVINHADMPAEAEEIKELVSSRFQCVELYVTPIGPCVTIHGGLGARYLGWYHED